MGVIVNEKPTRATIFRSLGSASRRPRTLEMESGEDATRRFALRHRERLTKGGSSRRSVSLSDRQRSGRLVVCRSAAAECAGAEKYDGVGVSHRADAG
jgi:hypothetical protein